MSTPDFNELYRKGPREPSAAARTLARELFDNYSAFRTEGFTDDQAMDLIRQMMSDSAYIQAELQGEDDDE